MADAVTLPVNLMNGLLQTTSSSYVDSSFFNIWDASLENTLDALYGVIHGGMNNVTGCVPDGVSGMSVEFYNQTDASSIATYEHYGTYPATEITSDLKASFPNAAAGQKVISVRAKILCGTQITLIDAKLLKKIVAPSDGSNPTGLVQREVGWEATATTTTHTEKEYKRMIWDATLFGTGDGSTGIGWVKYGSTFRNTSALAGRSAQTKVIDPSDLTEYELSKTGTSFTYEITSDLGSTLFTNGNEITQYAKETGASNTNVVKNGHILIYCTNLNKFEAEWLIGNDMNVNFGTYIGTTPAVSANRFFTTYKDYASGVTKVFYHEACATRSTAETGKLYIYDDGSNMTGSDLTFTTTAASRQRSGSLTEPGDGSKLEQYGYGYTTTPSTMTTYVQRLLMQVSGFDAQVLTTPRMGFVLFQDPGML